MTTSHDPREPLDADELELAGLLARLGPIDGPPPALDAKILGAAHAAVAADRRAPRRRWWTVVGVPPAMITGMGVAAATVLALGLVWQMRPRVAVLPAAEESGEEVFIVAEPAGARAPAANPPPFDAAAASADADAPAARMRTQPEPTMAPGSATQAAKARAEVAQDAAAVSAAPEAFPEAAPVASAPPAPPAPPAAPAPVFRETAREEAAAAASSDGYTADTDARAADKTTARQRRATYTSAARATAERAAAQRAASNQAGSNPARPAAGLMAPAAAPAADTAARGEGYGEEPSELDRIEATGSRMSGLEAVDLRRIPAREDARLDREDWLARIRARRDVGDLDAARESLRLFRREYPQVRLPDDVLDLLVPDPAP